MLEDESGELIASAEFIDADFARRGEPREGGTYGFTMVVPGEVVFDLGIYSRIRDSLRRSGEARGPLYETT